MLLYNIIKYNYNNFILSNLLKININNYKNKSIIYI